MERQGTIETDLVRLVDKGETVSKCGTTRRIGGVKKGNGRESKVFII
jgi:hypothetical protein